MGKVRPISFISIYIYIYIYGRWTQGTYTNIMPLTVTGHAQSEAFLEPTVLTPVSVYAVHYAVLVARTLIVDHWRLRPTEESLTALARDHAVVDAAGLVAAHLARYDLDLSWNTRQNRLVDDISNTKNNIILFISRTGIRRQDARKLNRNDWPVCVRHHRAQ